MSAQYAQIAPPFVSAEFPENVVPVIEMVFGVELPWMLKTAPPFDCTGL
jgi:hypothetical protein